MTPLRGVRKLLPGERLVVERGRVRVERWWHYPAPSADPDAAPAAEWAEIVLDKLDESVRMRLMSDVPLGAMLSGGLDSSLIVALMARHMTEPVETFAVGFAGEDSELPDARRVAAALRRRATTSSRSRCTSDPDDLVAPHLAPRRAARRPVVARLPRALRARLARTSRSRCPARAPTSSSAATASTASRRSPSTGSGCRGSCARGRGCRACGAAPGAPARLRRRAPGRRIPPRALLASSGLVHADLRGELFGGALAEHAGAARARRVRGTLAGAPGAAPLEAALYLDARLGLVDDMLTYFDRASMACSLEVRVPFLDHELVELCARDPDRAQGPPAPGQARAARGRARPASRTSCCDKRKRGFFNEAVGAWLGAGGRRDRRPGPAPPATPPTPRSSTRPRSRARGRRVARRAARQREAPARADRCSSCGSASTSRARCRAAPTSGSAA